MAGNLGSKIISNIPPAPDVLAVAAAADDEQDPIAVIQSAVDAHHDKLVEIIVAMEQKLATVAQPAQVAVSGEINRAEDRANAMRFLDDYTKDMEDVRRFDPNTKKGNYTGPIIHLTDHYLIQQVGGQTFIVHDRAAIEQELGRVMAQSDKLQIKYNTGRIAVNEIKPNRGQAVNEAISRTMSADKQAALTKTMNTDVQPNIEPDQEHGA